MDPLAQQAFADVVARLVAEPDVVEGKAFHAPGVKVAGKLFAMLIEDRLVVKLPAQRVEALLDSGHGEPFRSGQRAMREWVSLGEPSAEAWAAKAQEALAFVRP